MAENSRRKRTVDPKPSIKQQNKTKTTKNSTAKKRVWIESRKIFFGIAALIAVVFLVVFGIQNRTYRNYKVLATSSQQDTVSTKYIECEERFLRYSTVGASLLDVKQNTLWTDTYEMQNPIADICDETIVVADQGGTSMRVYNKTGCIGSITTGYEIVKAKVAKQGVVAAILDGGEDTWINFYTSDGTLIAENQTRVEEPGYPMDIAVSRDGLIIMVSFQFVDGNKTTSYVAFYNFSSAGQSQIDNIVSGYKYEGTIIPEVEYLSDNYAVAFRNDGFVLYEGKQIPKEIAVVETEEEIISIFHDDSHVGLVFKDSSNEDKMYRMEVYSKNGNKLYERSFNIPYTDIKMSGGDIIMTNSTQAYILNGNGRERFDGAIDEGTLKNLIKIGNNRYVLVLDSGIRIIKLS